MRIAVSLAAFLALASHAYAAEPLAPPSLLVGPWRLGMSPKEIQSFSELGPYSPVRVTGGLETANGQFQGRETSISFVFDSSGLEYIQIWKYEGKDDAAAREAVVELFQLFSSQYGGAEVGNVEISGADEMTEDSLRVLLERVLGTARSLAADIDSKQKQSIVIMFDMMPKLQPPDSRLHSQWGYSSKHDTFYVFLFQDRKDATPRRVNANVELGDP